MNDAFRKILDSGFEEYRKNPKALFEYCENEEIELDLKVLREVATHLEISPIWLYAEYEAWQSSCLDGVLTVCDNMTCMGKGAMQLKRALKSTSLAAPRAEFVKCLGGCSQGPCVRYRGRMYFHVSVESLFTEILQDSTGLSTENRDH